MLKPSVQNKLLFAITILFALLQLPFIFSQRQLFWDEAVYLGMGKYLYSLGGSGLWETIRPPGLPLLTGLIWKAGLPFVLFSRIISVFFGIGSILLTFAIANKVFGKRAALLSATLLASAPVFFRYSPFVLSDIPSAFFVLSALYFFISRRYFLCGIAAAIAMLFKFPGGLVLAAITVSTAINYLADKFRKRNTSLFKPLLKVAASFAIPIFPFLFANWLSYRQYTTSALAAALRPFLLASWHQFNPAKAVNGQVYSYAFYFVQAFRQHFAFVFAIIALFFFWKNRWFADSRKLLLGTVLAVFLIYFSYIPNKDERFLLLFLPVICIFAAAAFFESANYLLGFIVASRSATVYRLACRFALVAAFSLLLLSFAVAAFVDYNFYLWNNDSGKASADELYSSLSRLGIPGPVLTSDPIFAAYNNNRFFHYYDSSMGIPKEPKPSNDWERNKPFEAVIYSPENFFCPFGDLKCYFDKEDLAAAIKSSYKLLFNKTYEGVVSYYIFVNESFDWRTVTSS